jgi:ribulose-5-phosphate 4-epimerase/fuculose-1-phosphate aldolase
MTVQRTLRRTATRADFSPEEWAIRVELAACYRIFDHIGWTEAIYNHITMRVPGSERHFLINPFGLHYSEVRASNLVKVDLDGNVIGASEWGINPAGYVAHSAVHAVREDAHCIMHTHTTTGVAIACMPDGLEYSNFYSCQLYGQVAYHDFEGITVDVEERPRMARDLGDKHYMILRNHGLLAMGETIPLAFARLWTLQRACDIQHATKAMGGGEIPISAATCERAVRQTLQFSPEHDGARLQFDALVRQVDAKDPSYKL